MVSGVAALLEAQNPLQSGGALRRQILATCQPATAAFQPAGGAGAGLLSARNALQTPMLPDLQIASVTVDDSTKYSTANNGNGALDKGETVRLIVSLKNNGADAIGVSAILSTTNTLVTLGDTTGAWGTIRSGQTALPQDGFTSVTLAASAAAQNIDFNLLMTIQYTTDSQPIQQTLSL